MTRSKKVRAEGTPVAYEAVIERLSKAPMMQEAFDAIRKAGPDLNSVDAMAAEEIRAVEAFLKDTGVGVSAMTDIRPSRFFRYSVDDESPVDAIELWLLKYGRPNDHGEFCIFICHQINETHPNSTGCELQTIERPWHQWPREIRLEAHRVLPNLIASIAWTSTRNTIDAFRHMQSVRADDPQQFPYWEHFWAEYASLQAEHLREQDSIVEIRAKFNPACSVVSYSCASSIVESEYYIQVVGGIRRAMKAAGINVYSEAEQALPIGAEMFDVRWVAVVAPQVPHGQLEEIVERVLEAAKSVA